MAIICYDIYMERVEKIEIVQSIISNLPSTLHLRGLSTSLGSHRHLPSAFTDTKPTYLGIVPPIAGNEGTQSYQLALSAFREGPFD